MAALAAVKSSAGLVTIGTDRENIPALHSHLPEAMAFSLQDQQLLKSTGEGRSCLAGAWFTRRCFWEKI